MTEKNIPTQIVSDPAADAILNPKTDKNKKTITPPDRLKSFDAEWDNTIEDVLEWFIWIYENDAVRTDDADCPLKLATAKLLADGFDMALAAQLTDFARKHVERNKDKSWKEVRRHCMIEFYKEFDEIYRIRSDSSPTKDTDMYASYKVGEGWRRLTVENIKDEIGFIASDFIVGNQSLTKAVSESMAEIKMHMDHGGLIVEWNNSRNSIPFHDDCVSVSLKPDNCGEIIHTPRDDRMFDHLAVTADEYANDKGTEWQELLDLWFGDSPEEKDMQKCLQTVVGQGIAGNPSQLIPIWYGLGGNGKSTFIKAFELMLGDEYSYVLDRDYFLCEYGQHKSDKHSTEIFNSHKSKITFVGEIPSSASFNEDRVKKATGSDRMTARELYKNNMSFTIPGIFIFYGNYKPAIKFDDEAMMRRIKLFHFKYKVKDRTDTFMTEEELTDLLKRIRGQVLRWVIDGLKMYYENGNKIHQSSLVDADTNEYFEGADRLSPHLNDILQQTSDPNHVGPRIIDILNKLREESKFYKNIGKRKLAEDMEARGYSIVKHANVNHVAGWEFITAENIMTEEELKERSEDMENMLRKLDGTPS